MNAIVLDASVAVKLVSEEPDSQIALERVAAASRIVAPDWMMIEAAHALWKKTKRSSFEESGVRAGIDALGQIIDKIVPSALYGAGRARARVKRRRPRVVIADDMPTFDEAAPQAEFTAILLQPTP